MNVSLKVSIRINLPNFTMDGVHEVNLDEYKSIGTHRLALYANDNNAA